VDIKASPANTFQGKGEQNVPSFGRGLSLELVVQPVMITSIGLYLLMED
jgi:hypothetical protein